MNKTKKKSTIKAPVRKKNQPLGESKGPLKNTGKKAMHSKLVKVWKRKKDYSASALKNYKCDAHCS